MNKFPITFRPLREPDLPLLVEWLNRPHLQRWWRNETVTLETVREKYLPRLTGHDAARPFIACFNEQPVGYIQYYRVAPDEAHWWPDIPGPGVLGIDQFLADGDGLGQGLGTLMVSQFISFLMDDPDVVEIRVDPRPDNLRAIRCYEKVGFEKMGPTKTPDGPATMMVLKRKTGGKND